MKTDFLMLTLIPLTMIKCHSAESVESAEGARPNILFILTDDWGYGDLGCYGHSEVMTPHIDQLAQEGTRFTQFHVASGVSSPSRAAILTGHCPARNRIHGHLASNAMNEKRDMPNWLDENIEVLMPKIMQSCGYTTAHFGKWHLGGGGLPHGDLSAPEPTVYGYDEARVWNGNGPTWEGDQLYETTRYMDQDTLWAQSSSRIAVDEAISFLKRNKDGDKPMFVNLWLKDPHTPLYPTDEQRAPYSDRGLPIDKEKYYAVLTDADYHIGRLMAELKKMGLDDNTLVIFSSDNGPTIHPLFVNAGSSGGLRGKKTTIFQGGVDVPFIIRWPGRVEAGAVDTTSVLSSLDLLPTFCSIAGGELPSSYVPDGESIVDVFESKTFKRNKPIFWEWHFARSEQDDTEGYFWAWVAVRDGDYKLLANESQSRVELFNIVNDPTESIDISSEHPTIVSKMLAMWNEWKSTLP